MRPGRAGEKEILKNRGILRMSNDYSVLIIDNAHYMDPETERIVEGFATLDEAIAFARNRVRSSVEELRSPGISKTDLRKLWLIYGENASVIGGDYSGGNEVDYFIEHQ